VGPRAGLDRGGKCRPHTDSIPDHYERFIMETNITCFQVCKYRTSVNLCNPRHIVIWVYKIINTPYIRKLLLLLLLLLLLWNFSLLSFFLGNIHLSWDAAINSITLGGLICSSESSLQLNMCRELQIFAAVYMYWGAS